MQAAACWADRSTCTWRTAQRRIAWRRTKPPSSTRQAIKGPAVVQGKKLYIYPEQYEGQESDPLIFCTGPVPAQQVEPLIPWLMQKTGAKKFYLPSADYIWPHTLNKKVREVATANGGAIVGEEYFPSITPTTA